MLESLTSKVTAWEKERDTQFLYDGVSTLMIYESLIGHKTYNMSKVDLVISILTILFA